MYACMSTAYYDTYHQAEMITTSQNTKPKQRSKKILNHISLTSGHTSMSARNTDPFMFYQFVTPHSTVTANATIY